MKVYLVYLLFTAGYLTIAASAGYSQQHNSKRSILHETSFERDGPINHWVEESCRPDAVMLSDQYSRKGRYSLRFELAKTDPLQYNGYVRAELKQGFKTDPTGENWYGFSNFLTDDFVSDSVDEVIAQWHEIPDWDLGEDWRSPPISLRVQNGRYLLKIMWASNAVNSNRTKDGEKFIDLGPIDKNRWNDWVFHIKFRFDSTGVLQVWKNKVKLVDHDGPNSYNDRHFPYFKLGIYKPAWARGVARSPGNKRVLFIDEVKVGNRYSNLYRVSPR